MRVLGYEFRKGDMLVHDPIKILQKVYRGECSTLLTAVSLSEYPSVVLGLYERRCPFCGARARNIWGHIRRSKCRLAAVAVALDILGKYREFKKRVDVRVYNGRARYCIVGSTWFYDPFEAYEFYKKVVGDGGSVRHLQDR